MKRVAWIGDTREVLRAFPVAVRKAFGEELMRVQNELDPTDWKAMKSIGPGVREIRVRHQGQYRTIYVANRDDDVYVLHVFKKTTQRTPKPVVELSRRRLRALEGS